MLHSTCNQLSTSSTLSHWLLFSSNEFLVWMQHMLVRTQRCPKVEKKSHLVCCDKSTQKLGANFGNNIMTLNHASSIREPTCANYVSWFCIIFWKHHSIQQLGQVITQLAIFKSQELSWGCVCIALSIYLHVVWTCSFVGVWSGLGVWVHSHFHLQWSKHPQRLGVLQFSQQWHIFRFWFVCNAHLSL